jgi:diguanylate cyclase (GGDEF)-like protein
VTASARDLAAEERDSVAGSAEEALLATAESGPATIQASLKVSSGVRADAAADRADAASDRRRSALDRARAAADRAHATMDRAQAREDRGRAAFERGQATAAGGQARLELARSQRDELTGAHMREQGRVTLQLEIDRSRRSGEPFVLAFIDVDGLKELNDQDGHAAGDALLQAVVAALRSNLRSYDPLVRLGGDEFLCGFTNTDLDTAQRRVTDIRTVLEDGAPTKSITVGLATLSATDTLQELTARADADMYAGKHIGRTNARGDAHGESALLSGRLTTRQSRT